MRRKVKAIVFDVDGVLVHQGRWPAYCSGELRLAGSDTDGFFKGVFADALCGKADLKEILPPYLTRWNCRLSCEDFVNKWFAVEDAPDHAVIAAALRLRDSGFLCCLASNQEKYRARYIMDDMQFGRLFDRLFFSCALGCVKPDLRFFQRVTDALQVSGPEILFFDDNASHVAAARQCGWNAEQFTTYHEFARAVEKLAGFALQ